MEKCFGPFHCCVYWLTSITGFPVTILLLSPLHGSCQIQLIFTRFLVAPHYFVHPCDSDVSHKNEKLLADRPANAIIIDEKGINLLLERLALINTEKEKAAATIDENESLLGKNPGASIEEAVTELNSTKSEAVDGIPDGKQLESKPDEDSEKASPSPSGAPVPQ